MADKLSQSPASADTPVSVGDGWRWKHLAIGLAAHLEQTEAHMQVKTDKSGAAHAEEGRALREQGQKLLALAQSELAISPHQPVKAMTQDGRDGAALHLPREIMIKLSSRYDGGLRVRSDDVPGLFLSSKDIPALFRDLPKALAVLIEHNGLNPPTPNNVHQGAGRDERDAAASALKRLRITGCALSEYERIQMADAIEKVLKSPPIVPAQDGDDALRDEISEIIVNNVTTEEWFDQKTWHSRVTDCGPAAEEIMRHLRLYSSVTDEMIDAAMEAMEKSPSGNRRERFAVALTAALRRSRPSPAAKDETQ